MNFINYRPPRRYVVSIFTFFGMFLVYAMRLNLSVAVVSMTSYHPVQLPNGTIVQVREFDWSSKDKGFLLSSFFYGYVLSEFPGGWLSKRFGGATILGLVVTCSSISTLLLPFVAEQGIMVIIIFRAVVGIFEGGSFPSMYTIFSRWAPNDEKSVLLSVGLTGPYAATAICLPLYGVLSHYYGWRSLFYVSGVISLLWVALWFKEIRNDPKDDPKITQVELKYIQDSVGEQYKRKVKYPWKKIFTSLPVWAIFVTDLCECWGYFTMLTELPSFLNDVYQFDDHDAGILSGIPYIVTCIGSPLVGLFADYLRKNRGFSTTCVRKFCNSVCYFGQAAAIGLITLSPSPVHTMILLVIWMSLECFTVAGIFGNYLDIAPEYAGVIMGLANTFGCLAGSLGPMVAGFIVTNRTRAEWNMVLLLCSGVYFIAATFFLIFASGEVQEWAKNPEIMIEDEEHKEKDIQNATR